MMIVQVASYLGVTPLKTNITTFADSEISVEMHESVRGKDVYIMQVGGCHDE